MRDYLLTLLVLFAANTQAEVVPQRNDERLYGEVFDEHQKAITFEAQRWGAIYTQLITQNLSTNSLYRDQVCWINLRLRPTGHIRKVTILHPKSKESYRTPNQELFCNEVFLVAFRLKRYPMPKQIDVIKKLLNVNLTIRPLSNEAKTRFN
ncbi:cell envelope integrity TolA family protein [Vibrio fluvialis]|uniref:cell envelope integrity protein TolA n=1 Tax=Vibrio fluvialis TaxID=676 RepID=UPI00398C6B23